MFFSKKNARRFCIFYIQHLCLCLTAGVGGGASRGSGHGGGGAEGGQAHHRLPLLRRPILLGTGTATSQGQTTSIF